MAVAQAAAARAAAAAAVAPVQPAHTTVIGRQGDGDGGAVLALHGPGYCCPQRRVGALCGGGGLIFNLAK